MTNPFTVIASEVREGARTQTLPPSLPAILVICIVGFILLFVTMVLLRTRTEIRSRRLKALLARERVA